MVLKNKRIAYFCKMNSKSVVEHITNWLKTYIAESKTKGFVVGISGGIDSAVTSTLCAKTGISLLCLEMPIHQAPAHVSRAQEHIEFLKKKYKNVLTYKVNLTSAFADARAKQQQILGNTTPIGLLAANQTGYFNFLKDNSLTKGIL